MQPRIFYDSTNSGAVTVTLPPRDAVVARERGETFKKFDQKGWQTTYRKGLMNTAKDPTKTERIGAVGEQAFHILTGLSIDVEVKSRGNKFDFLLRTDEKDLKIEIGTQNYQYYEALRLDRKGTHHYRKAREKQSDPLKPLQADIYVFGLTDQFDGDIAQVMFEGWITVEDFRKHCFVDKALRGTHDNYYIHKSHLKDMLQFLWQYRNFLDLSRTGLF